MLGDSLEATMRFAVVVALCGLGLAGCKTTAEEQKIQAATDSADCARLGAAPGTERAFQCRLAFETQRRNADAIEDAANQARVQQAARDYGFAPRGY